MNELLTVLELLIHIGREEPKRPASLAFRTIECRIGVLDQLVGRPTVRRRESNAYAAADRRHDAADDNRLAQGLEQAAALGFDGIRIVLSQEQREFIASEAS